MYCTIQVCTYNTDLENYGIATKDRKELEYVCMYVIYQ